MATLFENRVTIEVTVNGAPKSLEVEPSTLLSTAIREILALTGTHIGCDTSQCGCCTVLVNGNAVKSCTMLAVQANGSSVETIEGLASQGDLHPVQASFTRHHALQCGFCTPGFVMSTVELVRKHGQLEEKSVRHLIEGNICRCTGYMNIVDAIVDASSQMKLLDTKDA